MGRLWLERRRSSTSSNTEKSCRLTEYGVCGLEGTRKLSRWDKWEQDLDLWWVGWSVLWEMSEWGKSWQREQEKLGQEAKMMGNRHTKCLTACLRDRAAEELEQVPICDEEPWNSPILHTINKVYRKRKMKLCNGRASRLHYHNKAT